VYGKPFSTPLVYKLFVVAYSCYTILNIGLYLFATWIIINVYHKCEQDLHKSKPSKLCISGWLCLISRKTSLNYNCIAKYMPTTIQTCIYIIMYFLFSSDYEITFIIDSLLGYTPLWIFISQTWKVIAQSMNIQSTDIIIEYIQGGPERLQQLWALISKTSLIKGHLFLFD